MIQIEKISKKDWMIYSEDAHKISFQKIKPKEWDRIDFALIAVREGRPLGYLTCRELDAHSLYWQFGGTFPGTKGTTLSVNVCKEMINWAKKSYERISCFIENTNKPMLKLAMHVGFQIIGTRAFQGSVLVEHLLELEGV